MTILITHNNGNQLNLFESLMTATQFTQFQPLDIIKVTGKGLTDKVALKSIKIINGSSEITLDLTSPSTILAQLSSQGISLPNNFSFPSNPIIPTQSGNYALTTQATKSLMIIAETAGLLNNDISFDFGVYVTQGSSNTIIAEQNVYRNAEFLTTEDILNQANPIDASGGNDQLGVELSPKLHAVEFLKQGDTIVKFTSLNGLDIGVFGNITVTKGSVNYTMKINQDYLIVDTGTEVSINLTQNGASIIGGITDNINGNGASLVSFNFTIYESNRERPPLGKFLMEIETDLSNGCETYRDVENSGLDNAAVALGDRVWQGINAYTSGTANFAGKKVDYDFGSGLSAHLGEYLLAQLSDQDLAKEILSSVISNHGVPFFHIQEEIKSKGAIWIPYYGILKIGGNFLPPNELNGVNYNLISSIQELKELMNAETEQEVFGYLFNNHLDLLSIANATGKTYDQIQQILDDITSSAGSSNQSNGQQSGVNGGSSGNTNDTSGTNSSQQSSSNDNTSLSSNTNSSNTSQNNTSLVQQPNLITDSSNNDVDLIKASLNPSILTSNKQAIDITNLSANQPLVYFSGSTGVNQNPILGKLDVSYQTVGTSVVTLQLQLNTHYVVSNGQLSLTQAGVNLIKNIPSQFQQNITINAKNAVGFVNAKGDVDYFQLSVPITKSTSLSDSSNANNNSLDSVSINPVTTDIDQSNMANIGMQQSNPISSTPINNNLSNSGSSNSVSSGLFNMGSLTNAMQQSQINTQNNLSTSTNNSSISNNLGTSNNNLNSSSSSNLSTAVPINNSTGTSANANSQLVGGNNNGGSLTVGKTPGNPTLMSFDPSGPAGSNDVDSYTFTFPSNLTVNNQFSFSAISANSPLIVATPKDPSITNGFAILGDLNLSVFGNPNLSISLKAGTHLDFNVANNGVINVFLTPAGYSLLSGLMQQAGNNPVFGQLSGNSFLNSLGSDNNNFIVAFTNSTIGGNTGGGNNNGGGNSISPTPTPPNVIKDLYDMNRKPMDAWQEKASIDEGDQDTADTTKLVGNYNKDVLGFRNLALNDTNAFYNFDISKVNPQQAITQFVTGTNQTFNTFKINAQTIELYTTQGQNVGSLLVGTDILAGVAPDGTGFMGITATGQNKLNQLIGSNDFLITKIPYEGSYGSNNLKDGFVWYSSFSKGPVSNSGNGNGTDASVLSANINNDSGLYVFDADQSNNSVATPASDDALTAPAKQTSATASSSNQTSVPVTAPASDDVLAQSTNDISLTLQMLNSNNENGTEKVEIKESHLSLSQPLATIIFDHNSDNANIGMKDQPILKGLNGKNFEELFDWKGIENAEGGEIGIQIMLKNQEALDYVTKNLAKGDNLELSFKKYIEAYQGSEPIAGAKLEKSFEVKIIGEGLPKKPFDIDDAFKKITVLTDQIEKLSESVADINESLGKFLSKSLIGNITGPLEKIINAKVTELTNLVSEVENIELAPNIINSDYNEYSILVDGDLIASSIAPVEFIEINSDTLNQADSNQVDPLNQVDSFSF